MHTTTVQCASTPAITEEVKATKYNYLGYSSVDVQLRINDEKPFKELWKATIGRAAFAPDAVEFIRKLQTTPNCSLRLAVPTANRRKLISTSVTYLTATQGLHFNVVLGQDNLPVRRRRSLHYCFAQSFCRNPRRQRNNIAGRRLRERGSEWFRIFGTSTPRIWVGGVCCDNGRQLFRGDSWLSAERVSQ